MRIKLEFVTFDGGRLRAFDAAVLGHDDHGMWLASDAESIVEWADGARGRFPHFALTLVPSDGSWWTVSWPDTGTAATLQRNNVYGNISLPPNFHGSSIRLVDLDLDVVANGQGGFDVVDLDDFAANSAGMAYPDSVATGAVRAAETLRRRFRDADEPFGHIAERWFEGWRRDG